MIKLKSVNGRLELPPDKSDPRNPEGRLLMIFSKYGEPETFSSNGEWDKAGLARALFDERERGYIPADAKKVELPNGKEFEIDGEYLI